MIRILHFKYALKTDGATAFLLDLCENMDAAAFSCDFLLGDGNMPDEIRRRAEAGGRRIYAIAENCQEKNRFFYTVHKIWFCCRLMKENHYDMVHVHTEDAGRGLVLLFARLMGIKGRILHSHNSFTQSGKREEKRQQLFRQLLPFWANGFLACSAQAAHWMFPRRLFRKKKVVLIPNGIRLERFRFSGKERVQYRKMLEAGPETFLLCTAGRLVSQKNYRFLLLVIKELMADPPNRFRLLFIGDGPERERLEQEAGVLGVQKQVAFLGVRDDIPQLLWAADGFLLPSFFEGLPVSLVEAQAAGLPCGVSSQVTRQVKLTDQVAYLPVKGQEKRRLARQWADWIRQTAKKQRDDLSRLKANDQVRQSGFAIQDAGKKLERYYVSIKKGSL